MSSTQQSSEAGRLKAEGNTLFLKSDFAGAYKKYSEALKHDDRNAVLYCNRAACSLGLNRYLDAATDATKATELDATYAKAWSRLASARAGLNSPILAVEAWKRAVASLPVENLTATDVKQRDQYRQELAKAEAKLSDLKANPRKADSLLPLTSQDQTPWKRAAACIPDLTARQVRNSSAWIINAAYIQWQRALELLNGGQEVHTSQGPGFIGKLGAIEQLTNALLTDHRVFHITDTRFFEMYNKQSVYLLAESETRRAWLGSGCRGIIEEVPRRLEHEGWDSVRPALSITVRGWIMRAFMEDKIKNSVRLALELYTSALELLEWGVNTFADVDSEQRGAVFEPTFIRSIKSLRLDSLMRVYLENPGPSSKHLLEEMLAGADELLEGIGAMPDAPTLQDVWFILAFYSYPAGQAHAIRGFCYQHIGTLLQDAEGLTQAVRDLYKKGSSEYAATQKYYPPDDQYSIWYVHRAFRLLCDASAPLGQLLPHLHRIRDTMPVEGNIWEFVVDANHCKELQEDLDLLPGLEAALQNGLLVEDTVLGPGGFMDGNI